MTPVVIKADDVAPQAWRNGGGWTRELLVWPPGDDWRVRVSRADIETDGPFSSYPGVERWFTVLAGAGVALQFAGKERILKPGDAPIEFDGAARPDCTLIDGPTQDLNLMVQRGSGLMQTVQAGTGWSASLDFGGIYTTCDGTWRDGSQSVALPAHSLLWCEANRANEWTFAPSDGAPKRPAWWLGYRHA
jgi:environmental stress-induced protein Ves